jgi:hypothetical protein
MVLFQAMISTSMPNNADQFPTGSYPPHDVVAADGWASCRRNDVITSD